MGIFHICLGVGMGGGTHTGLIGEQAPLGTLGDGGLQGHTKGTAHNGLGLESILEDQAEGLGDELDPGDQHDDTACQEDGSHDGNQLFGDGSQTLGAADEDQSTDTHQHYTHDPAGDTESGLDGGADGVGLDHAAEEAQGDGDSDGEEASQELAEAALDEVGDVVHGAAQDFTVLDDTGLLGQNCLSVDGGHAQEGDDPHPEDSAGAAGEDSAGSADDVAGTDLSGDGGGQSLEGTHALLLLAAAEGQVTENLLHTLAEATNLNEFCSYSEEQACVAYNRGARKYFGEFAVLNEIDESLVPEPPLKYKGVTYDVRRKKWKATICVNYKQVQLGRFNTQREAFEARVKAEKEHNFKDIQEWKGETNFEY